MMVAKQIYSGSKITLAQSTHEEGNMPVVAKGKNIVEKSTGRVVAHGKTKASAKKAARMRNMAHAVKRGHIKRGQVSKYFGEKGMGY